MFQVPLLTDESHAPWLSTHARQADRAVGAEISGVAPLALEAGQTRPTLSARLTGEPWLAQRTLRTGQTVVSRLALWTVIGVSESGNWDRCC